MTKKMFPTGVIRDSPETIAMLEARVLPRVHFLPEELPESVDLSCGLPPVGTQRLGDCVCWAIGYYQKTHDEFEELGWDVNVKEHQFSPSYLFNSGGRYPPSESYNILVEQGCCTLSNFPYTTNTSLKPTDDQKEMAKPYKIKTYGTFSYNDLHAWRETLANGKTLTITALWSDECEDPASPHYIIDSVEGWEELHQLCICGYSLDINGTGISGFKFVNSHGTNYADNGFAWFTDNYLKTATCRGYWMQDMITPPSNLYAEDDMLIWDGPEFNIYDVYKTTDIIDTVKGNSYGPVPDGTYGIGAYGSEMIESVRIGEYTPPSCLFGVIT